MKARVIETGKIVEVQEEYDLSNAMVEVFYSNVEDSFDTYAREELDFNIKDDNIPDYWTRLKHQYAGMAMQGLLCNRILAGELVKDNNNGIKDMSEVISKAAVVYATALVEKLKEERK